MNGVRDKAGEVFAVAQLLNRKDGERFDEADEKRFMQFTESVGVILQSWWQMAGRGGVVPKAESA